MFGDQWPSVSAARIKDMIQIPGLETTDYFMPPHFKRNCQIVLMQIAQMPQAPVLSFSWRAEQSKLVEGLVPADLPVPQPLLHCPGPSPVSLLPGSSSQATTSLQTNFKKIPNEIKKKKGPFQILRVLHFISYLHQLFELVPFRRSDRGHPPFGNALPCKTSLAPQHPFPPEPVGHRGPPKAHHQ